MFFKKSFTGTKILQLYYLQYFSTISLKLKNHLKYGSEKKGLHSVNALSSWVFLCQKNKRGCILNFYQKIKSQTS